MKSILKDTIDRHSPFVAKRVKGKKSPWMYVKKNQAWYEHTWSTVLQSSQIKKAIRLGFIKMQTKLWKKKKKKIQWTKKKTLSPKN